MITIIVKLGGFLGRKNDGPPGITTLWRGLHRLHDIVTAFRLLPHSAKSRKTCA